MGDITNIANRYFFASKGGKNVEESVKSVPKDDAVADVESPEQQQAAPAYQALGDSGASPIRNALWNDENVC